MDLITTKFLNSRICKQNEKDARVRYNQGCIDLTCSHEDLSSKVYALMAEMDRVVYDQDEMLLSALTHPVQMLTNLRRRA